MISDFSINNQKSTIDNFSHQAVGKTRSHVHRNIASLREFTTLRSHEVKHLVLRGAADPLASRLIPALNHHFNLLSDMPPISLTLNLALLLLQNRKAAGLFVVRNSVRVLLSWSVRTRGILEGKDAVVSDFIQK